MGLIEDAKKVAEEFEYSAAEVSKGVEEFIRQMGQRNEPMWRSLLNFFR